MQFVSKIDPGLHEDAQQLFLKYLQAIYSTYSGSSGKTWKCQQKIFLVIRCKECKITCIIF